jgi:hypothetical protein
MYLGFVVAVLISSMAAARAAAQEKAAGSQGPAVRWSGYLQARETYRDGVGLTASINRARLSAAGNAAKDVTWRVQGEFQIGEPGVRRGTLIAQAQVKF